MANTYNFTDVIMTKYPSIWPDELIRNFSSTPVGQHLFNQSNVFDYPQIISRALDLFSSPIYDNHPTLYNPRLKLSLHSQFTTWLSKVYEETSVAVYRLLQRHLRRGGPSTVGSTDIQYAVVYQNVSKDPNVITPGAHKLPARTYKLLGELKEHLAQWYIYPGQDFFIAPLMHIEKGESMGHAIVFMCHKNAGVVSFRVFNSYPYKVDPIEHIITFLKKTIQEALPAATVQFLESDCPVLQVDLGNNCSMWQALIMTLLAVKPEYFEDPAPLLQQLHASPHVNIILFQLYFFLFLISDYPHFLTRIVFADDNMLMTSQYKRVGKERAEVDKVLRDICQFYFDIFDCSSHSSNLRTCSKQAQCEVCDNKCVRKILVFSTPCDMLTLEEMANEFQYILNMSVRMGMVPFDRYSFNVPLFLYVEPQQFIHQLLKQKNKQVVKKYIKKMKHLRMLPRDFQLTDVFPEMLVKSNKSQLKKALDL